MNRSFLRAVSRVLLVCFTAASFQVQAGLVGTGTAVQGAASPAAASAARETIVGQLEALGLTAGTARERVAAISDAEALEIAGRIDRLPAGADGAAVGMFLVACFLLWRFAFSDQAKAESKAREASEKKEAPAKK